MPGAGIALSVSGLLDPREPKDGVQGDVQAHRGAARGQVVTVVLVRILPIASRRRYLYATSRAVQL
jgi:hypothetical protein